MNKVVHTLGLCFVPLFILYAQQSAITDSLQNAMQTATPIEQVDIFIQLSEYYRNTDYQQSKEYGEQALNLANELQYKEGQAGAYTLLGMIANKQAHYKEAEKLANKAMILYQELKNSAEMATNLNTLGISYRNQGQYSEAIESYQESLKISETNDDQGGILRALNNLGNTYREIGSYPKALEYFLQALRLSEEINDQVSVATIANNIGGLYEALEEYDKAIAYFTEALHTAEALNHQLGMSICLANIGKIHVHKKEYVQAHTYSEKGLSIAKDLDNKYLMGHCIQNFANIFLQQGNYEESNRYALQALGLYRESNNPEAAILISNVIAKNYQSLAQYDNALQYANTALEEAKSLGIKPQVREALENLSAIYATLGNYPQAYQHQAALLSVKDSLLNEEKTRQMAELQTLYETEKKEKEIVLLEKQKTEQRFEFIMMMGGLLVILLIGFLLIAYQRVKIRKNRQLLEKNKQVYETHQALIRAELENAKLREKELQQALEFKNKELTTHTLNLVQKNSIMEELKSSINTVVKDADGQVVKKLNSLKRLVDYSFNLDKDWEEFRMHFEQVHKDFFTEMMDQFPNLTPSECRLSALIKLNLNTKEMATIMAITPDSVKIARYRLRKKLGLSTEDNLTEFIINFDRNVRVHA